MNRGIIECALVGQTFETRKRAFLAASRLSRNLLFAKQAKH